MPSTISQAILQTACFLLLCLHAVAAGATEAFPVPSAIAPNVAFWEKVYGHYSIHEAVLHDRRYLGLVYGTIALEDNDTPGAAERNRLKGQEEIRRLSELLRALANGAQPKTERERQVASLFAGRSPAVMQEAADNIRLQNGLKERFLQGVRRSGAYIKEFRRIFAAAGLPQELAYLPHVESSFDPQARSKVGAVGLWQFTHDTGRRYLTVNQLVDERLDPWTASHAAARYLKESHQALGDWPLALTSYNYGRAGMLRAKNALGSYERVFSEYNGGHFKFASRNFYPEFIAALQVARRLEADPSVVRDRALVTTTREMSQSLTLDEATRRYSISRNQLLAINPSLLAPVVTGKRPIPRGYVLRLPSGASAPAVALADKGMRPQGSAAPAPAGVTATASQRQMLRYQVQPGDTISAIARRHKVEPSTLIAANSLKNQATIQAGQYLYIPTPPVKRGENNVAIKREVAENSP